MNLCSWILVLGAGAISAGHPHLFGIQPKTEHIQVETLSKTQPWQLHPHSVAEFVLRVGQPSFTLLGSGETDLVDYAFFRVQPNILIFASAFKRDDKSNGSVNLSGRDGNQSMLDAKSPLSLLPLLDTQVEHTSFLNGGDVKSTFAIGHLLCGYAARIDPHYSGPLTMHFQFWNEGRDKVRSEGSPTINWQAAK